MATVFLGLGSNVGNKQRNIDTAFFELSKLGKTKLSPIYITKPFGHLDQDDFLNCVVKLNTTLELSKLFEQTQAIEKFLKKNTPFKNGPRTIDIDILLYDNIAIETDDLTIPHPHMHERTSVLQPLHDIAPNVIHPILGKTISELFNNVIK